MAPWFGERHAVNSQPCQAHSGTEEKMRGVFIDKPWFWLLFQATWLFIIFIRYEEFQLIPVDVDAYWYSAISVDWSSLTEILSSRRTFGYPLFLQGIHVFSPWFTALPICQLALRVLAVWVYYLGLRHLRISGWLAVVISSSLLYPETIFPYFGEKLTARLMSDSPAQSLAILTMGTLFMVIGRPRSAPAWLGLMLGLFLTYQTRPVYLFLVLLVPLLGLIFMGLVSPRPEWVGLRKRLSIGLVAVCVLPLLAWCTLRWAVVGQFGLVSIGGSSLVGIVGQVLTEDLVPELPEDLHRLARRALEERNKWSTGQTSDRLVLEGGWQPPMDSDNQLRSGVVEDGTTAVNTQFLFEGAANELYGYNNVEVNRKLAELSWAIIKAKPRFYLLWLAKSFRVAVTGIVKHNYLPSPLLVLLTVLLFIWGIALVYGRFQGGFKTSGNKSNAGGDYSLELMVLLLGAVSFAFSKILVIVPVATPEGRYLAAAGVFIPPVAVMIPVAVWGQVQGLLLDRRTRD
jgi:hypothetical protein